LTRGLLDKKNLLSLIQNFIIFTTNDEGRKIKIVSRYQQFRAVAKMMERLADPSKSQEEKGGIVWHTQGSGKSLTMVFLVRALRNTSFGKEYKVVFLTDRRDLQRQIGDTAQAIGEHVYPRESSKNTLDNIQELLTSHSSQIVNAMVHKFRSKDEETLVLPVLNKSKKIIMLIDEAHRSHASLLGANVMNALPNAIKVAFTGTPIITGKNRKKSHEIFGGYIDTYTIDQAVKDGATVQIYYQPRTSSDEITDKEGMDQKFADVFDDKTKDEQNEIVKKYGSKKAYLENPSIIEQKASDMIKHYLES
jgi:type I restriction enzyme R subunit